MNNVPELSSSEAFALASHLPLLERLAKKTPKLVFMVCFEVAQPLPFPFNPKNKLHIRLPCKVKCFVFAPIPYMSYPENSVYILFPVQIPFARDYRPMRP